MPAHSPESQPAAAETSVAPTDLTPEQREKMLRDAFGGKVYSQLTDEVKEKIFSNPKFFSALESSAREGLGEEYDRDKVLAGKMLAKFGIGVGEKAPESKAKDKPAGAKTLEEIEAQAREEEKLSPAERIQLLTGRLEEQREILAKVAAKRGTRLFTGNGKYEFAHAAYLTTLRKLTGLKLNHEEEFKSMDPSKKLAAGMMYMDADQTKLREMTTEKMQGTAMGKLVTWMNKGGRFKRFLKYAAIGGVGAAAGAAVGIATAGIGIAGAGGAAIGLGAGGLVRGFRGLVAGEAKHGRTLGEYKGLSLGAEDLAKVKDNIEEVIDKSTRVLGELFNGAIKERRRKHRRAIGRGALYATLGVGAGAALSHFGVYSSAKEMIGESRVGHSWLGEKLGLDGTENTPGKPVDGEALDGAGGVDPNDIPPAPFEQFTYNAHENPFYMPGKAGIHDMGPALNGNPALDKGVTGLHDMTQVRWVNSPEQLASVYSSMGLNNVPDSMLNQNNLSEAFRINPADMQKAHEKVMDIMSAETTHVREVPLVGNYESEYMVDPAFESGMPVHPGSNPELYWDSYVANHGGTAIVVDYVNPSTGLREELMFRKDCGGQRIKLLPEPAPQPVQYSAPSYSAPQVEYQETPVVYEETPVYVEETPPPPPVETPPPPVFVPPVELPPPPAPPLPPPPQPPFIPDKPPVNPLDNVIPNVLGPSPVGSGELRLPASRPPSSYSPPSFGGNDNSPIPGLRPPRNIDLPSIPGLSPGGGSGRNRGLI